MKTQFYKSIWIAVAVILAPVSSVMAGNGGGGKENPTAHASVEVSSDGPATAMVTVVINVTPTQASRLEKIALDGPGTVLSVDVDKNQGVITVVMQNGGGGPGQTGVNNDLGLGRENSTVFGNTLNIVGIDNISGVYVGDNGGSNVNITLRPVVISGGIDTDTSGDNGNTNTSGQTTYAAPASGNETPNTGGIRNDNNSTPEIPNVKPPVDTPLPALSKDVEVFPNPARDQTNIVTVAEILVRKVEVVDLSGRRHLIINPDTPTTHLNVNVSSIPTGVYIMIIETSTGTITKKLYKTN